MNETETERWWTATPVLVDNFIFHWEDKSQTHSETYILQ